VAAEPLVSRLDWSRDGLDWPNRAASRFIDAGGLRWHVQRFGPPEAAQVAEVPGAHHPAAAPAILLLHGTGAATHSWRDLAPRLAGAFSILAPDLPGHGFTTMPARRAMSMHGMARAIAELLQASDFSPSIIVGHSAGAAIAARMQLDGLVSPKALISLNGAFLPLGGLAGKLFSPAAQLLAGIGFAPQLLARLAGDQAAIDRLLASTGSTIDQTGRQGYARLVRSPGHIAGALAMMANWNLDTLERDLPRLETRLLLLAGANDLTVPPEQAARVSRLVRGAELDLLPGLGHLAHEEKPALIADRITAFARDLGLNPASAAL
jgi:magnesium chelatase accessory protein